VSASLKLLHNSIQ